MLSLGYACRISHSSLSNNFLFFDLGLKLPLTYKQDAITPTLLYLPIKTSKQSYTDIISYLQMNLVMELQQEPRSSNYQYNLVLPLPCGLKF